MCKIIASIMASKVKYDKTIDNYHKFILGYVTENDSIDNFLKRKSFELFPKLDGYINQKTAWCRLDEVLEGEIIEESDTLYGISYASLHKDTKIVSHTVGVVIADSIEEAEIKAKSRSKYLYLEETFCQWDVVVENLSELLDEMEGLFSNIKI